MVDARGNKVFIHYLIRAVDKLANVSTGARGHRIEGEIFLDPRIDSNGSGLQDPVASIRRRHVVDVRNPLCLANSFIVREKEGFVLNDWAANTHAELISLKRRFASRRVLKVIARIQRAIS